MRARCGDRANESARARKGDELRIEWEARQELEEACYRTAIDLKPMRSPVLLTRLERAFSPTGVLAALARFLGVS